MVADGTLLDDAIRLAGLEADVPCGGQGRCGRCLVRKDIESVLIGGAFGQHINVEKSILIGLLPDLPWDRFHFLGNTSALGAYQVLVSRRARRQVEDIAGRMTYFELAEDSSFMNEYTSTLFLPYTDMEAFPTVKEVLAKASRNGSHAVLAGERGER
ncbi:MAG: ASKHA domain-containing protein [Chloroflexota bacterium]